MVGSNLGRVIFLTMFWNLPNGKKPQDTTYHFIKLIWKCLSDLDGGPLTLRHQITSRSVCDLSEVLTQQELHKDGH